jgi:hypothetical protein
MTPPKLNGVKSLPFPHWRGLKCVLFWLFLLWGVVPLPYSYGQIYTELPKDYFEDFKKPYDIYLTENRVCKKCRGKQINETQVILTDLKGKSGLYPANEIIGVDNHPLARKLFLQSAHGIGFPARIIVPQAFDDEAKYLHY